MPDESGSVITIAPSATLHGRSITGLDISPTFRWTQPGGFFGIRFGGMHEVEVDPTAINFMSALHVDYMSKSVTQGVAPWLPDMLVEQWTAQMDGAGHSATTGLIPIAFGALPALRATGGARLAVLDRCALSCNLGTNVPCRQATEAVDCAGCVTGTANSCTQRGGLMTIYAYPTLHADRDSRLSLVRRSVIFDSGFRVEAEEPGSVTLETDNTVFIADRSGANATRAIESRLTAGSNKYFLYAEGDAPSVHAGRLRIGDVTPPAAALDLAPGRDRHLRMAGFPEDPVAPRPGDVWYNTEQHAHRTRTAIGTLGNVGVLATATADSDSIRAPSGERPFSNGFAVIPATSLSGGKTIRLRAGGRYSTGDAAALRLTVRWGMDASGGGNLLVDTGQVRVGSGVIDGGWTLDADVTMRSAGTGGKAAARGLATFGGGASPAVMATDVHAGETTMDTTVETPLALFAAWSGSAAIDAIVLEVMTVEVVD
jgi:hypothetical protein